MAVPSSPRLSIARKAAGALLLLLLAQWLFYGQEPGGTLSLFTLAWCAVLPVAVPALRRGAPVGALAAAAALALFLIDDPSPLGWSLTWTMIATAALLPSRRFDDAFSSSPLRRFSEPSLNQPVVTPPALKALEERQTFLPRRHAPPQNLSNGGQP